MSIAPPPAKPAPPPAKAPRANGAPAAAPVSAKTFAVSKGIKADPIKAVIYGTGGAGKSELAANISQVGVKILFIDLERGSMHLDVDRIDDIETYEDLRSVLHNQDLMSQFDGVCIDSLTRAEELGQFWVIQNVPHEKGHKIERIEDYGFGKGYTHVYEAVLRLIGDMDMLSRRGKHVIAIAHECINKPENPEGENVAKYEPRLMTSKDGKNSIRYRIKEWASDLLYIKYDVAIVDGKAKGSGSRAIYPQEMPSFWAKSRTLHAPIVYEKGSAELWRQLLKKGE